MGWLWLAVIGAGAFAMLWATGVSRGVRLIGGAALLFGASGYAWQQHATLGGHPVKADAQAIEVDPGMVTFRSAIMPGEAGDAAVMAAADDRLRAGDRAAAAQIIRQAIAQRPNDSSLWAEYGSAIATHDGGQVSPAAQYAFRRAFSLSPDAPGPPFFLGMANVQGGELAAAKAAWLRALALAPRDAPWRVDIAERLVLIDQFQAMQAGAKKP